jgi:hypothetical protein
VTVRRGPIMYVDHDNPLGDAVELNECSFRPLVI